MTRFCGLTIFALCLVLCAAASAQPPARTLIVILLPGTSLTAWRKAAAPNLDRLMATGALAVMNTRTARLPSDRVRETPESAALTLGAGSRAVGGPELTTFAAPQTIDAQILVSRGSLYERRMGQTPAVGCWVNEEWAHVIRENQQQNYDLRPGNLGDALTTHGIAVEAAGGPSAFPIACTGEGAVRVTPVSLGPTRGCVIIDAGADIPEADALIGKAMERTLTGHGRLIVLSPSVNDTDYAQARRLAPVALWGPDIAPSLLYSPSTHRAGLVANTDFAWTVTSFFGATDTDSWLPTQPFGRPWRMVPSPNALTALRQIEQDSYAQAEALRILPTVAIVLGVFVLIGVSLLMTGRRYPWTSLLPLFMIDALAVGGSMLAWLIWLVGLTIFAVCLRVRFTAQTIFALGAAGLAVTLTGDMLLGDPLMRHSLLGYSAVEGARYYGMGNEAMGALVGSALVTAAFLHSRGKLARHAAWIGLVLITLLLGSPLAGAKAGGLLVAVASFGAFLWTVTGRTWTRKTFIVLLAGMALALALVSLGDLRHHGSQQTHMGQAAERIRLGGWREASDVIARKLAVETRLLYHSAWACPLWAGVLGLMVWKRKQGSVATLSAQALSKSGGIALITCLLLNDAGVVAAALCGVILWSSLTVLETNKRPASGRSF